MPDLNHQSLLLIVDRGASTEAFEGAQLGGIQALLQSLDSEPGLSTVTMVQFDDDVRVTALLASPRSVWIDGTPGGGSAVYDAIAVGVIAHMQAIDHLPEHARPWAVQVLVVSDGRDSASQTYDEIDLINLLRERKSHEPWNLNLVPVSTAARTPKALIRLEEILRGLDSELSKNRT
jgi:hypothetical protein